MSGKKFFQIDPENQPNRTSRERVVSERGRKELPPGTKGGENLKPDRHYEQDVYKRQQQKRSFNFWKNMSRNMTAPTWSLPMTFKLPRGSARSSMRSNTAKLLKKPFDKYKIKERNEMR